MGFWQATSHCFKEYVTFKGRATRSEFWYFTLFLAIAGGCLGLLDGALFGWEWDDPMPISNVFSLGTLVPSIAVTTRRLHDVNRSGWWQLLYFTIIGIFVLLYWCVKKSDPEENRFG